MHLLSALSAGIQSCPGGSALLKLRSTATDAPNWEDFEGTSARTTGAAIPLNAYGQAEVYVDAIVDVTCRDKNGVTKWTYTDGPSGIAVEVKSTAITGTPYGGGGAATGQPTTLKATLDKWLTNNGAPDWKVLLNGVATTVQAALANTASVYNVKNTAYAGGAVGDGTSDDTGAINAAIAACQGDGGGIVVFPPGIYKITSRVDVPDEVSLFGWGAEASTISVGYNGIGMRLTSGSKWRDVYGLKFVHASVSSSVLLDFSGSYARVTACAFDGALTNAALVGGLSTAFKVHIDKCIFTPANNQSAIDTSAASAANTDATITGCRFTLPTTHATQYIVRSYGARVVNCQFDLSAVTSGTPVCIDGTNGGIVTGCRFIDAGVGITWFALGLPTRAAPYTFTESGNEFGQGTDPLSGKAYKMTDTSAQLCTRESRFIEYIVGGAATILTDQFGIVNIQNTAANGAVTITEGPEGGKALVMAQNDHASNNWGPAWSGAQRGIDTATIAPDSGNGYALVFVDHVDETTIKAIQVSAKYNTT